MPQAQTATAEPDIPKKQGGTSEKQGLTLIFQGAALFFQDAVLFLTVPLAANTNGALTG